LGKNKIAIVDLAHVWFQEFPLSLLAILTESGVENRRRPE
jgi:hypothetical protein